MNRYTAQCHSYIVLGNYYQEPGSPKQKRTSLAVFITRPREVLFC